MILDSSKRTFKPFSLTRLMTTCFGRGNGEKVCILIDLPNPADIQEFKFLEDETLSIQNYGYETFYMAYQICKHNLFSLFKLHEGWKWPHVDISPSILLSCDNMISLIFCARFLILVLDFSRYYDTMWQQTDDFLQPTKQDNTSNYEQVCLFIIICYAYYTKEITYFLYIFDMKGSIPFYGLLWITY